METERAASREEARPLALSTEDTVKGGYQYQILCYIHYDAAHSYECRHELSSEVGIDGAGMP